MQLRPGMRLRSQVCSTEVIVVRTPAADIDLCCGGKSMVELGSPVDASDEPVSGMDGGSKLGKRYAMSDATLEVLVTKPGAGTLAAGDQILMQKTPKPLPTSD